MYIKHRCEEARSVPQWLLALLLGLSMVLTSTVGAEKLGAGVTPPPLKNGTSEAYGKLPLHFEANEGQSDSQVKFLARARGYDLFLTPTETVLALRKPVSRKASLIAQLEARRRGIGAFLTHQRETRQSHQTPGTILT